MSDLIGLATQLDSEDFDNLPVIDLGKRRAVASEIRNACLNAGFFFIKNHGVPTQVVEDAFESAKGFFGQEADVKETVDIHKSDNFRGYMKLLSENNDPSKKGEVHEAFNLGLDKSLDSTLSHIEKEEEVAGQLKHSENLWPEESAWSKAGQFKSAVLSYYAALLALGQSLFPLFALALDLQEDFFDDKIRHPAAIMRLLRYPGTPREERKEDNPGIGAHTDFECFTILAQGGKGLEVQNRKGQWIEAPMIPNAFVLNIGDQFARWTNGIFQSTRHRVLPPIEERYSIPFFFGCDHDVPLIPPATCVSEERPARYEVMTAGAYVHMRLSETYGAKKEQ